MVIFHSYVSLPEGIYIISPSFDPPSLQGQDLFHDPQGIFHRGGP